MNKDIILYGAGKRGSKIADLLKKKGWEIAGFCDANKADTKLVIGETEYYIYSKEYLVENKEKFLVIVCLADNMQLSKVEEELRILQIEMTTVEEFLDEPEMDSVARNRKFVADYHADEMGDYYQNVESEENVHIFWGENSIFYKMFTQLDVNRIVELACGHGRHVPRYLNRTSEITLVDILESNIVFCEQRFAESKKIKYYVNNGYDLCELSSNYYTALFTYDAMVHFEMIDVFGYLKETYRILKKGGRALFHHSNNTEDYKITFSTGTSGRNYMSAQLFAYLANRANFNVLDQSIIDWNGVKNLDCLTLVEKI